jgi:hypothetical protein
MLQNNVYIYSVCEYNRSTLDDGDVHVLPKEANAASFAVCLLSGEILISNAVESAVNGTVYQTGSIFPPCTHDVCTFTAIGAVDWICLHNESENPDPEVQFFTVSTSATLPSGWGFFVATGSVNTSDGVTAEENNYYRPRNSDITLSGNATLILIK